MTEENKTPSPRDLADVLAEAFFPNIVDSYTTKDGSTYELIQKGDPPEFRVQFWNRDCSYSWKTDFGDEASTRDVFDHHVRKSKETDE